jgi:hypothetical protein
MLQGSHPRRRFVELVACCMVGSFSMPALRAQSLAGSQTRDDSSPGTVPQRYSLGPGSTFQQGCFPPCQCPILAPVPVLGTFGLSFANSDPLFDNYEVTDVSWSVPFSEPDLLITGSGTYRVGGDSALTHQLQLDLIVGDGPVQHFDSGLVVGGTEFPAINITISLDNARCFDTVIHIEAVPCVGDLDGNLATDLDDVTILLQNFRGPGVPSPAGDVDGDADTDLDDLTLLLQNFGAVYP